MSYFYVYDKFVQEKKYEREVVRIEKRLTDIGIQGKIGRLALFRHAGELVRDEAKRGVETVIVVGNDATFHNLMSTLPEINVTIGFIPIGESCRIAEVLGVPMGAPACDVLSARITETLDVGKINNQYFLTSAGIFGQEAAVTLPGRFKVGAAEGGGIEVRNLGSLGYKNLREGLADPRDGMLEVVVFADLPKEGFFSRAQTTQSVFRMKQFQVEGKGPFSVVVDGVQAKYEKLDFGVAEKSLRMIVGKNRLFV